MFRPIFSFSILIIFLFCSQASAITWRQILEIAAQKSNDIKSAQKQAESSKLAYYRAYSSFLPQISANASTSQTLNPFSTAKSYSYGLSASQAIFTGLANYYALQSAYLSYKSDESGLNKSLADFFYSTRLDFITLYIARENIKVQHAILGQRSENARLIKLRYESGKEDDGNYMRTQAQLSDAKYNVRSAERDLELAKFKISQILETKIDSSEGLGEVAADKSIDLNKLLEQSPDYKIAKYTLDLAETTKNATISEFLPTANLSLSYSRSGSDWPPSSSSKSLSLSFSLPIFPGGRNVLDYMVNAARYEKAKEDFEKTKKNIRYNIKSAYEGIKDALEAFAVQKQYLSSSKERVRIGEVKYLNGLITYDEWDRILNEFVNSEKNINNYYKNVLNAQANLYKSFGGYIK